MVCGRGRRPTSSSSPRSSRRPGGCRVRRRGDAEGHVVCGCVVRGYSVCGDGASSRGVAGGLATASGLLEGTLAHSRSIAGWAAVTASPSFVRARAPPPAIFYCVLFYHPLGRLDLQVHLGVSGRRLTSSNTPPSVSSRLRPSSPVGESTNSSRAHSCSQMVVNDSQDSLHPPAPLPPSPLPRRTCLPCAPRCSPSSTTAR